EQTQKQLSFRTVYFGGGTPSQLGAENLCRALDCIDKTADAEVTVECNPSDLCEEWTQSDMDKLVRYGANRISMGMQSAVEQERKKLGRRAGAEQVRQAVEKIKAAGITDFSLDLMLGIPFQTVESVKKSVAFCAESGATHLSAYLLKIEQGTPFEKVEQTLNLPNEDECCELYLTACEEAERHGFGQYEISNFAKPGHASRHNLIYWNDEEYIGVGAAAHSFYGGKRYYYERDAKAFADGTKPVADGEGGDFEEYAMLRLRLTQGLTNQGVQARFGHPIPQKMFETAKPMEALGLVKTDENTIRMTPKGFLVSNGIIAQLLGD
ncbi:MAG TPA: coproporphyrinogen III oxidase, partial [Ruminococcaceae bacterium]|nr:coproporphyrinogen III oxidase [Oscillospiraceae bacterium]